MKKENILIGLSFCFLLLFIVSIVDAKVPDTVLSQKKAVVTIYIYEKNEQKFFGSGFIIDSTGIVATNYHVISSLLSENTSIAIRMENGDFVKAEKIIGIDEDRDVALIKLDGKEFPSVKLARDYKPQQGEDVVVIGSPFGLETTVSNGIISSIRGKDEFLQITAPISPGSSGSPVFDSGGDVIGIATLLLEGGQNLNFAIPVKYIEILRNSLAMLNDSKTPSLTNISHEEILKANDRENSADYHIKMAKEYSEKSDFDAAIEEYTKAIALKADDATLFYSRGEAKDYQGRYDEAVADYSKAILLNPKNGFYYFKRHSSYLSLNKYELALKDISKAIDLKKTSPDLDIYEQLFSERGWVYVQLEKYDKAFEDYKKATKIDPNALIIYPLSLFVSHNKVTVCIKFLTKMISVRPKDVIAYSVRSDLYSELKQYDKAMNDVSKAIELNPDNNYYYYDRGMLYMQKGDPKKAKSDFQKLCYLEDVKGYLKKKVEQACNILAEIEQDEARGEQWVRFAHGDQATFFYNKNEIKQNSDKTLRVWLRSEGGEKPSYIYEDKDNYSHSLLLLEYDCKNNKYRTASSIDYGSSGKSLSLYSSKSPEWESIIPDSIGDILYKIVCARKKKVK